MNIGSLTLANNVALAPMSGITDLPFRLIVRRFGCGLGFTEMVSANGISREGGASCRYLRSSPDDVPLGVQIFGADPKTLADAARIVSNLGADLLDVNMGCPAKKVVRTGAGAALMENPELVARILHEVRRATALPLTIKIRSGWERSGIAASEIARIAEDCGIDAVILHPRTAEQGFGGRANWQLIGELKGKLRIPVIGNGDIRGPGDALRMQSETGCDGVMVGRGALGNPWIFEGIVARLAGREIRESSMSEREGVILDHLSMSTQYSEFEERGIRNFRKHLLWYTKGLRGGPRFRKMVGIIHQKESLSEEISRFFQNLEERTPSHESGPGIKP